MALLYNSRASISDSNNNLSITVINTFELVDSFFYALFQLCAVYLRFFHLIREVLRYFSITYTTCNTCAMLHRAVTVCDISFTVRHNTHAFVQYLYSF